MAMRPTPSDYRSAMSGWLKWVLIITGFVLILIFIYLIYLYQSIQQQKTEGFDKTEDVVLNHTNIAAVEEITHFQGDIAYDVVLGTTKDDKQQYVFVPKQKENTDYTTVDADKTISKQKIVSHWKNQCSDCKLVRVTPAMINENPLWEVSYWNSANRYIMEYLSIYDGKRYQQFRFKNMFN